MPLIEAGTLTDWQRPRLYRSGVDRPCRVSIAPLAADRQRLGESGATDIEYSNVSPHIEEVYEEQHLVFLFGRLPRPGQRHHHHPLTVPPLPSGAMVSGGPPPSRMRTDAHVDVAILAPAPRVEDAARVGHRNHRAAFHGDVVHLVARGFKSDPPTGKNGGIGVDTEAADFQGRLLRLSFS